MPHDGLARCASSASCLYGIFATLTIAGCVSAPLTVGRSVAASTEPAGAVATATEPARPTRTATEPARPATAPTEVARVADARSRIVTTALKYVGAPYARGGASPAGFDCSGFVMYVYRSAGVALPHSANRQYRMGSGVSRAELKPGDIVFFDRLRHSGIYLGDGKFIHASKTGDFVKISRLDERWFRSRWVGGRQLL